jgi:hypothetical protein
MFSRLEGFLMSSDWGASAVLGWNLPAGSLTVLFGSNNPIVFIIDEMNQ